MQNIFLIFLVIAATNVHADWMVQTSCNSTNPISGYHAIIENGNCVKYGDFTYLIQCDFTNSVYQSYLCHDDDCTDCTPTIRQSIGVCDEGVMSMCFVDKVDYNKILPAIGAAPLYYGEINYNYQNSDCSGTAKAMKIVAANQCITTGVLNPYRVTCDGSQFTYFGYTKDDLECTTFPIKITTGMSGSCNSNWKIESGCNIPLI